jgi:hypothetical protein
MKEDIVVALRQPGSFLDDPLTDILRTEARWTCPEKVPDTYLIYAARLSNARGLLPPNVECLRRGL